MMALSALPATSTKVDQKCMAGQLYSPNKSNLNPVVGMLKKKNDHEQFFIGPEYEGKNINQIERVCSVPIR